MVPQQRRSDAQRKIARAVWGAEAAMLNAIAPFRDRGLSKRTIDALVARGIDAPERLLFTTEVDLKNIPGIGRASFAEISARFIPTR